MAHYAFLNYNNVVVQVIAGKDEDELLDGQTVDWEDFYAQEMNMACKRTSFNTYHNQHSNGGTPFRGNYAGIGFKYDSVKDIFIEPKPFPSWVFNETTCSWDAPVEFPFDSGVPHDWDEATLSWVPVKIPNEELWQ
jgi:hypothetical protein